MTERNEQFTIEIDCDPLMPRPSSYLAEIVRGTGIDLDPDSPDGTFFGNWTWIIPEEQAEDYIAQRELIQSRIEALYWTGRIRYGSW